MSPIARVTTKIALGLLFLVSLVADFLLIPIEAFDLALAFPEYSWLRWPASIGCWLLVLFGQIALVAIWKLVTLSRSNRLFDGSALPLLDALIFCGASAAILTVMGTLFLMLKDIGHPGIAYLALFIIAFTAGFAALSYIGKELLLKTASPDFREPVPALG